MASQTQLPLASVDIYESMVFMVSGYEGPKNELPQRTVPGLASFGQLCFLHLFSQKQDKELSD